MVSTFYYCAILAIFIAASSSSALEAKDALAPVEEPEKLDEAEMPDDFVHPLPLRRRGVAADRDLWGWWGAEEEDDDWNSGWGGSSSSSGKSGKVVWFLEGEQAQLQRMVVRFVQGEQGLERRQRMVLGLGRWLVVKSFLIPPTVVHAR